MVHVGNKKVSTIYINEIARGMNVNCSIFYYEGFSYYLVCGNSNYSYVRFIGVVESFMNRTFAFDHSFIEKYNNSLLLSKFVTNSEVANYFYPLLPFVILSTQDNSGSFRADFWK